MRLFGFLDAQEKAMFLNLISVSGIGPKVAMSIMSGITCQNLAMAISMGDIKMLSAIKGLGKKTAERIIVELKDKLGNPNIASGQTSMAIGGSPAVIDAVETLALLGINKMDAQKLVKTVAKDGMTAEEIVKMALKKM
jgi:Holliday junction DNA helicase RuvA